MMAAAVALPSESFLQVPSSQAKDATIVSKNTLIPVGVAIAVCVTLVIGTWSASSAFNSVLQAVDENGSNISSIREELREFGNSSWSRRDMANWVLLLRMQNPDLKIPEPK